MLGITFFWDRMIFRLKALIYLLSSEENPEVPIVVGSDASGDAPLVNQGQEPGLVQNNIFK
jgi:hypothetical protein